METESRVEWWFVVDPAIGRADLPSGQYPHEPWLSVRKRRHEVPLHTFDVAVAEANADLRKLAVPPVRREELIGGRLYTGPMFQKCAGRLSPRLSALAGAHHFPLLRRYNAVMRGAGDKRPSWAVVQFEELCMGNKYATTIWAINSAIVKLGKLTVADRVYRGVSGRGLPRDLRPQRGQGVTGGVDVAFLSTTRDREVAMRYAGREGFGLVLEIQQGLIDRGADLSWLSQYPFEREILFAPLTALQVVATRVEGRVQVVEMRPTINQNAQMIEQAIARMQQAQVQFVDLLMENFARARTPTIALRPLRVLKSSHKLREVRESPR